MLHSRSRISAFVFLLSAVLLFGRSTSRVLAQEEHKPRLDRFYDQAFMGFLMENPELLTQLRILERMGFNGHNAKLTDISEAQQEKLEQMGRGYLETLRSYDRDEQTEVQLLSTDIFSWFIDDSVRGGEMREHAYPLNQMFGVQSELPDFMSEMHQVQKPIDAEHYITRLGLFGWKLDTLIENMEAQRQKGIIPPRFVLDRALTQMQGFKAMEAGDNLLVTSFGEKLQKSDEIDVEIGAEFLGQARDQVDEGVYPAYDRLTAYVEELRAEAGTDDGVWAHPGGDDYYAYALRHHTTTDLTAEEIHAIGLSEVDRILGEMRAILDGLGHTEGTVGEIMAGLGKEDRFLYPDEEESVEVILERYREIIEEVYTKLGPAFELLPSAPVEVRRVPVFKEATSAGAYYNIPALDGSRPGVFYANMRDVREISKYGMKTLTYHEAVPGHHFQLAIQQEIRGVPQFRNVLPFTAFVEGWALYAERLAGEYGFYEGDPYGDLGRLQAELFRAVRLVVDTGIHHKRWTRERAIEYMLDITGMGETDVTAEIERYIVMPGQATAYKIGQLKFLELRARAKAELGEAFDIREFHSVVLGGGAMPFEILEREVDAYIEEAKG